MRLLLAEYQQNQGQTFDSDAQEADGGCVGGDVEKYEQSIPAHGDLLFHQFLQRIQQTPGQILRYVSFLCIIEKSYQYPMITV